MLEIDEQKIYLYRDYVDFRKQINGLTLITQNEMKLNIFEGDLFVFCCKKKDKLKIVYWQNTGFCMWQIRLEKDKFKWPVKHESKIICWDKQRFEWLLKKIIKIIKDTHHYGKFPTNIQNFATNILLIFA